LAGVLGCETGAIVAAGRTGALGCETGTAATAGTTIGTPGDGAVVAGDIAALDCAAVPKHAGLVAGLQPPLGHQVYATLLAPGGE
jgi:hypothetical protein